RFACSCGKISACINSAYGRCGHCCSLGRSWRMDSRNVSFAPGSGPMYGGFMSRRTFLSMLFTTASCSTWLRRPFGRGGVAVGSTVDLRPYSCQIAQAPRRPSAVCVVWLPPDLGPSSETGIGLAPAADQSVSPVVFGQSEALAMHLE